jgi:hypothetical protein
LGGGRTAVMIINTVDKDPPPPAASTATTKARLGLAQCNSSKKGQHWLLSPGVSAGDSPTTNIITALNDTKLGKPDCIGIHACATKEGAQVTASGGCRKLPTSCANSCNCNGAWSFNKNGTISSVMDGQCLQQPAGGRIVECRCVHGK